MSGLRRVASYERIVGASIERAWENARDWEHLPWLHRSSFHSIELIEQSRSGWRARVGIRPESLIVLELAIDASGDRYVSRTLEGAGAGSEIWTTLAAQPDSATAVEVHFDLSELESASDEKIARIGASYRTLYTRLWDEDEAMMRGRARALGQRDAPRTKRIELGPRDALQLPLLLDVPGHDFRVVELDGMLVAHTTTCPHWKGPLEPTDDPARLECPWHGYAFDLRSGRSCDGGGLRLEPNARIETNPVTRSVTLLWS